MVKSDLATEMFRLLKKQAQPNMTDKLAQAKEHLKLATESLEMAELFEMAELTQNLLK